jgi:hypothetical protein
MSTLVDTIIQKHAGLKSFLGGLGPVQAYNRIKASPSFKVKKRIGQAALVASPTAYAAHWLDKPEEPPKA